MLLIILQIATVSAIVVGLFELRQKFGLALLFIFVGSNQYFQHLMATSVYVEVFGYTLSPGSVVLFSANLFAVLLVYISESVINTRRLIYGIALANAVLTLFTVSTRYSLAAGWLQSSPGFAEPFLSFDLFSFLVGTALLIVDTFFIILAYEYLRQRFPAVGQTVLAIAALLLVLWFDALIFMTTLFYHSADFGKLLVGNLMGKTLSAVSFGACLGWYLHWSQRRHGIQPATHGPGEDRSILHIFSYQKRYKRLKAEHGEQQRAHQQERERASQQLASTQEELRHAQKMEAVARLTGGIAHDFNNIQMAIQGNTDRLIEKLGQDHELLPTLLDIRQASERATSLTGQMLAFSRKQVLSPKVLSVNELIKGMLALMQRLTGEQVQLQLRLDRAARKIKADPSQVEQVIMNLVVNARDAMPAGGLLTVASGNAARRGPVKNDVDQPERRDYTVISVTDTGEGMSQQVVEQVFEPFFTTKPIGKGTGLGLSTVYGIVEQSGGFVELDSSPGAGTEFRVYFPSTSDSEPVPQPMEQRAAYAGSLNVLLVEDEDLVRALTRAMLEHAGHRVVEASDGHQALELLQANSQLDLLLTDIGLPGMAGTEVAEKALGLCPHLRVVFMSGYIDETIREQALGGKHRLLKKPFDAADLQAEIAEAMADAEPARPV